MASASAAGAWPAQAQAPEKLPVVATFSILADFARNVGGERIEVTALVGPNGDTHVYQPKPADAKKLGAARLILVNGLGLEGWIDRLIKASGATAPVVVGTKGISAAANTRGRAASGQTPMRGNRSPMPKSMSPTSATPSPLPIPAAPRSIGPIPMTYLSKLDALDKEVRAEIAKIPPARREIITTHDAFGYFGTAYGFRFIAPEGVSTETEASARDVAKIIRQIKAQKIPAVFLENVTDPRLLQSIAAESGAKIGGTLYSDALSPPDGPAATYIEMMRNNIKELSAALAN